MTHPPLVPASAARAAIAAGADAFGIARWMILGPSRIRRVSFARFGIVALLRDEGYTLTPIGRALGLDHTSVMHALKRRADMTPAWHAALAKAQEQFARRERLTFETPPTPWLLRPPKLPKDVKRALRVVPRKPTADDAWNALMGQARFHSITVKAEGRYVERMGDGAREL